MVQIRNYNQKSNNDYEVVQQLAALLLRAIYSKLSNPAALITRWVQYIAAQFWQPLKFLNFGSRWTVVLFLSCNILNILATF